MEARDLLLPLLGLAAVTPVLYWAWRRQLATRNAGVVDPIWSGSIGVLAVVYTVALDGWGPRQWIVAGIAGVWSGRLTWHLARRIASEPEDGRYAMLRRDLGPGFDRWILWWFLGQGLLAVVLSWAMLVPATGDLVGLRAWDLAAIGLAVVALGGEAVADRQLAAWREDPATAGLTCRAGLWGWSRHPNYFFEWLHWLTYPLLAVGLPLGWTVWFVPALMLLLVLKVTGIPPTERRAVERRGDDYRAYQRATSAFFPLPPRGADASSPREVRP